MKTLQLASLLRLEEDNMNFPGYGVLSSTMEYDKSIWKLTNEIYFSHISAVSTPFSLKFLSFQNTEGSCLMRLLGPEKSRISQKSH